VLLLGGCQTAETVEAPGEPAAKEVELLGGMYRRSGFHWLSITKGAVLRAHAAGGYCAASTAPKVAASGAYVCFYADTDPAMFDRAVVFSDFAVLEQFRMRDSLPFREVAPAAWPRSAPQV